MYYAESTWYLKYKEAELRQTIQRLCDRKLEKENPVAINVGCYKLYETISKSHKLAKYENMGDRIGPNITTDGSANIGPFDPEIECYHCYIKQKGGIIYGI